MCDSHPSCVASWEDFSTVAGTTQFGACAWNKEVWNEVRILRSLTVASRLCFNARMNPNFPIVRASEPSLSVRCNLQTMKESRVTASSY